MSVSTAAVRKSTMLKWSLICAIAIVIPGLQVGLPWLSCYLASDPEDADRKAMGLSDQRSFWTLRFSFDRFLHPSSVDSGVASDVFSATVCRNELVILQTAGLEESGRIDRIDLRTGRMTSSTTDAGIVSVLSDGDKLWFFYYRDEAEDSFDPFIYQGRVVRFRKRRLSPDVDARMTYELEWFEDEVWQPTGQFALVPFALTIKFGTDLRTEELYCFNDEYLGRYFQYGLKLRDKDEHLLELRRYFDPEQPNVLKTLQVDWYDVPAHNRGVSQWYWSENNVISAVSLHKHSDHWEFEWYRTSKTDSPRERHLTWPVNPIYHAWHHVVRSSNDLYVVANDSFDGRWTICRWDNGRLVLLVDQRSPLLGITCLDATLFATFAFVIPSIILVLVSGMTQHLLSARDEVVHEAALASLGRRSAARTIDLLSYVTPLLLSAVLHPSIVAWWENLVYTGSTPWTDLWTITNRCFSTPSWDALSVFRNDVYGVAGPYLSVPILPQIAALALATLLAQLVWQCYSGQTLGKWMMDTRVVRTDFRRPGWTRCLVREAFLLVDGLLFLSWVPGVICLLITSKSQRIGDLFSDTIVVRNSRPSSSALIKSR